MNAFLRPFYFLNLFWSANDDPYDRFLRRYDTVKPFERRANTLRRRNAFMFLSETSKEKSHDHANAICHIYARYDLETIIKAQSDIVNRI